jgi:hypothetical protein
MCGEEFWAHTLDEGDRGKVKQESLSKECSVQRDCLAVRIAGHQLLCTRCERGSSHRRRVRVLERDTRGLPANDNFVPVWKPLPRSVMLVPPDAGPDAGDSVPIPEGTFANWITLKPEVVMANRRLKSNMDLSSYKS